METGLCDQALVDIDGQAVHIRKVSKNIVFLDLIDQNEKRISVAIKSWESGELLMRMTRGKDKIHVGDKVSISGYFEENGEFSALNYSVIELWAALSPSQPFIPIPPSTNSDKTSDSIGETSQKPCKYFVNSGQCFKANRLFFHDDNKTALLVKRAELVQKKKEKQLLVHEGNFDGEVVSHSQRASVFCKWIVNTYGLDWLKGGIILDIAGGRGDLAFELSTKFGLTCFIVDPRGQKLKRWQSKYLKKNPEAVLPTHLTTYFDEDFFTSNPTVDVDQVRLVVGLHPDEATEPLVNTALKFQVPFSVIPCCVFSLDNPQRRLADGSNPTSYEDFCRFLKEKSETISEDHLSFIGKNKVLFAIQNVDQSSRETSGKFTERNGQHVPGETVL